MNPRGRASPPGGRPRDEAGGDRPARRATRGRAAVAPARVDGRPPAPRPGMPVGDERQAAPARRWRGGPWRWYPPDSPVPPRRPPPADGVRVGKPGHTWWSRRRIEALEGLGPYAARLRRGLRYARQGRVHNLGVRQGAVHARVTGSRATPYRVTLRLAPLSDAIWRRATRAMAERALFAARLLAGEMPDQIDEVFQRAGWSLFPGGAHDLVTECSCPDWANPCKHVAAVHYVPAELLDRDPFLLFELRGRSRDAVLGALRALRPATEPPAGPPDGTPLRRGSGLRRTGAHTPAGRASGTGERPPSRGPEGTAVIPPPGRLRRPELGTPAAVGATRPAALPLERAAERPYAAFADGVEELEFRIETPAGEGVLLRQLGAPPSWRLPVAPHALLQPLVAAAAARARELAFLPGEQATDEEAGTRPDALPLRGGASEDPRRRRP